MQLTEIREPLQGILHGDNVEFSQVCTDSRQLKKEDLFVALKGPNFDGHEYVKAAMRRGAGAALVCTKVDVELSQIQVGDTLIALGQLAALNRANYKAPLLALTGSAGKTTVKEMLGTILSQVGEVLVTEGNLNNEIGLPQTLLSLSVQHQYAVVEMGASKTGDIAYLTQICQPDIALITNALPAHIEGFGSVENVATSKGEIYAGLTAQGIAVINLDDPFAPLWLKLAGDRHIVRFSSNDTRADVCAQSITVAQWSSQFELRMGGEVQSVKLPIPGKHNLSCALAAAAGAMAMGVGIDYIVQGLRKFQGLSGRLQLHARMRRCKIIDDSYNANPASVRSAIDVLSQFRGRKTLVLGTMAELGEESQLFHQQVAQYARDQKVDRLLVLGEFAAGMVAAFGEDARRFEDQQSLVTYCLQTLVAEEVVLVKGSRSAGMERVVRQLLAESPPQEQ